MGRRNIYFKLGNKLVDSDFGNFTMLLLHAKRIDYQKFKVFDHYNHAKSIHSNEVDFDTVKLKACINLIDQLILNIKNNYELYELYDEDDLINILNNDKDFLYTVLYKNDNLFYRNTVNVEILIELRDEIFKPSLKLNKPHEVYIE